MLNTSVSLLQKGTSPHEAIWATEGIIPSNPRHPLDFHLRDCRSDGKLLVVESRETHLIGEGGVGLPCRGGAGVGLLHHLIDLL